ncbi:hypothetical protein F5883DRAFT_589712 [Diaporthe sp. PMI_573]|nr:hypothetical protein F5883DRAFT_589712 [Diaporthaceae sp. PMI_573]
MLDSRCFSVVFAVLAFFLACQERESSLLISFRYAFFVAVVVFPKGPALLLLCYRQRRSISK